MLHVTEAEVRERIKDVLDAAVRGEEIVIERDDGSILPIGRREELRAEISRLRAALAARESSKHDDEDGDIVPSPELGRRIVEHLRGRTKGRGLSTDEIMAMTRGED